MDVIVKYKLCPPKEFINSPLGNNQYPLLLLSIVSSVTDLNTLEGLREGISGCLSARLLNQFNIVFLGMVISAGLGVIE
jgi:hypothetical protein